MVFYIIWKILLSYYVYIKVMYMVKTKFHQNENLFKYCVSVKNFYNPFRFPQCCCKPKSLISYIYWKLANLFLSSSRSGTSVNASPLRIKVW